MRLSELFKFVIAASARHHIDESHSLGHSMRVFQFANMIAREESRWVSNTTVFVEQIPIIQAAAILHDTCDKKYRNEEEGLHEVCEFLSSRMPEEHVKATTDIIRHMSYSKVKKSGMPDLGEYQLAFHCVREADLLDAYDFDRSMIYHMMSNDTSLNESFENARALFETRVLKHAEDGLLLTRYAKKAHPLLSQTAIIRMHHWRRELKYTG